MVLAVNLKTGLIIDEPYISQVLRGEKTWEMRSQRTAKRERIGLIRKASGLVIGSATLVDCIGPLGFAELCDASDKHGFSKQQVEAGLLGKWNYAWVLDDVEVFDTPMSYTHPSGAVIWVDLTKAVSKENPARFAQALFDANPGKEAPSESIPVSKSAAVKIDNNLLQRPVARDGTAFSEELSRGGWFTVGEKGDEHKFSSYQQALGYLKTMHTAKWRRPNPKGNWGIVSAIRWE